MTEYLDLGFNDISELIPFFWKIRNKQYVTVFPRISVESPEWAQADVFKNAALISIRSSKDRRADTKMQFKDALFLEFDDIEFEIAGLKMMDPSQAKLIQDFVTKNLDSGIRNIICQCEAGISRSAAIAAAILKSAGCNDKPIFDFYCPNRHVYDLVLTEFQKNLDFPRGK
jgi:predicted protein tyrosine phosphatase